MKPIWKREKPPAVTNPIAHAGERFGGRYRVIRSGGAWEPYGVYRRTGDFQELDGGYIRHCGPTAIVNALLTLEKRFPLHEGRVLVPALVFHRIASFGIRHHFYWNTTLLGFFGGTLNVRTRNYIRRALAMYGRREVRVSRSIPSWPSLLMRALDDGAFLYLELVLHPLYGNHHLLVYGYRLLEEARSKKKRLYLLAADGWSDAPRYLDAMPLRVGRFLALRMPYQKK